MRNGGGHKDRVIGISFSPDSRRLLTISWDKTGCIWDVKTGQRLEVIGKGPAAQPVTDLATALDHQLLGPCLHVIAQDGQAARPLALAPGRGHLVPRAHVLHAAIKEADAIPCL